MGLKELIEKLKGMGKGDEREELPDDETRDKYLRSLRRERRTQMEEGEKEKLKKDIEEFKKQRERRFLWGITKKTEKKRKLIEALNKKKKVKILEEKHNLLGNKINKKKEDLSFLGKSDL